MPATFAAYSAVATRAQCSWTGLLDLVGFVLLVGVAQFPLATRRRPWLRYTALYLLTLWLVLLFVGNTAYWRFFRIWVHSEIFAETAVGPAVAWDAVRSLDGWDWGLGVAAPLVVTWVVARRRRRVCWPVSTTAYVVLIGLLVVAHRTVKTKGLVPREQNPAMHVLRDLGGRWWRAIARHWWAREHREHAERIAGRMWDYYQRPRHGYLLDTNKKFPLLRVPDPAASDRPLLALTDKRRPNIVLVLMESLRSLETGACGARTSLTPSLDRLANEGVLFRRIYANGSKTARGEFALLSSFYPRLRGPVYVILPHLRANTLPNILRHHGYRTLWIHAYKERFANHGRYLRHHGMQEIYDQARMPRDMVELGDAWGKADHAMFEVAETILDQQPQPFFAEILTLSNHYPWDWPFPTRDRTPPVQGSEEYTNYAAGVFYGDWCLGRFMERMRRKPYFDNTIFVFVSDHGTDAVYPSDQVFSPLRRIETAHRIPLLIFAPKRIPSGTNDTVGSQVDVAPTLLHLLGIRARSAFAGRSLLAEDTESTLRHVVLETGHRWNIRIGNRYLYFMPCERDRASGLTVPRGHRDDDDAHVLCESDSDLLWETRNKAVRFLPARERSRRLAWARDLMFMSEYLRDTDTLYDRACDDDSP